MKLMLSLVCLGFKMIIKYTQHICILVFVTGDKCSALLMVWFLMVQLTEEKKEIKRRKA